MKNLKKWASLALAATMILAGCGSAGTTSSTSSGSSTSSTASASSSENVLSTSSTTASSSTASTGKKLTFEYFTTSMTVEWMQQIQAALQELGEKDNFELLTADANRDINTQLSQIDTAINQKIDGAFLFIVDEGSATAAVQKFTDAGIPVIGETLKLQDGNGKNIAPYVELDANAVGEKCGKWVVDNWKSTGVDLSDLSKVGVIKSTNSKYQSDLTRADGFQKSLTSGLSGISESNIFIADCAAEATSTDNTEASYNQVNAIISSHPELTSWIIMGTVDTYALGACRAVEAAGIDGNTILVSAGGESAIKEWENGSAACWKATCYYSAMDFAEQMVSGMLSICRDGKDAKDIFSDFKEDGQDYAAVEISGNMCTRDDYKDYVH